jgi:hypothetical protein
LISNMADSAGPTPREIEFPVEYTSNASNLLLLVLVVIYIPLILAPLLIIRFDIATALMMGTLLLALAFGIYVFRGNPSKRDGFLKISPGDARIETKGRRSTFVIGSKGLSARGPTTLTFSQASLFETKMVFRRQEDCEQALQLIRQYY